MLRLDNSESGELIQPLTSQHLVYTGAPSAASSSPTYSSHVLILDGDSLTTAIGKLDAGALSVPSADALYLRKTGNHNESANGQKTFDDVAHFTSNFTVGSNAKITNLNADLLDGFTTGSAVGQIPINNGVLNNTLNADLLDSKTAGNANGNIPVSNGILCTNLNADLLDSLNSTDFVRATGSVAQNVSGIKTFTDELRCDDDTSLSPPNNTTVMFNKRSAIGAVAYCDGIGINLINRYNTSVFTRNAIGDYTVSYTVNVVSQHVPLATPFTGIGTNVSSAIITTFTTAFADVAILTDIGTAVDSLFTFVKVGG